MVCYFVEEQIDGNDQTNILFILDSTFPLYFLCNMTAYGYKNNKQPVVYKNIFSSSVLDVLELQRFLEYIKLGTTLFTNIS